MSLASELVTLTEEIKAKQTPWLALSAKANDDKQTLTPEEKDTAYGEQQGPDRADRQESGA